MFYNSVNQLKVFALLCLIGFIVGLIFEIFFIARMIFKNKKITNFVFDFCFVVLFALVFFYFVNILNFGVVRLYTICAYVLGFVIEQSTIKNLVAKIFYKIYNGISNMWTKFKTTKMFKIIFK